jgi:hypothetical protein
MAQNIAWRGGVMCPMMEKINGWKKNEKQK